jgi:Ca2+-binding RTX toxin-like protein
MQGGGRNPSLDPDYTDTSKDVLHGGPGTDFLDGHAGDDVIYGGDGNDGGMGEQDLGDDGFYGGMATIS